MEIEETKAKLLKLLAELEQRAASVERNLTAKRSSDSAEQAQERENDDVLGAIRQESTEEILEIRRALIRIEEGEYGYCAACGNDISPQRLEALPYATLCVQCAEKRDKRLHP